MLTTEALLTIARDLLATRYRDAAAERSARRRGPLDGRFEPEYATWDVHGPAVVDRPGAGPASAELLAAPVRERAAACCCEDERTTPHAA